MSQKSTDTKQTGLVGMFFHSLTEDGFIGMQGVITRNPEPGWYVVQTFDWLAGTPHWEQRLWNIDAMATWLFYDSAELMREGYEYGNASGMRRDRP